MNDLGDTCIEDGPALTTDDALWPEPEFFGAAPTPPVRYDYPNEDP